MTQPPNLSDLSKEEIKETLNEIRHPVDIVIYGASNYFNIAGIIRTAHSFLIRDIYLVDVESSSDPFYEKGTMGNHKYENIHVMSLNEFLDLNRDRNMVSFERRPGVLSTETCWDFVYPTNPLLVFGSEKSGIPDAILDISKHVVSIPMFGLNNDLNIATAAGIAMYDYLFKYYRPNLFIKKPKKESFRK